MNNSRINTIKNAKFPGYYFYMNLNILGDFQICISVPLNEPVGSFQYIWPNSSYQSLMG